MSGKPHYFAIGLFVLTATLLFIVGVVQFSSDAMRDPKYFLETYIDESVQGVEVGTPFKFRGMKIGSIHEIRLVTEIYETEKMYILIRVALDEKILKDDPEHILSRMRLQAQKGLRVKLVSQGITGLSFLDADYYPEKLSESLVIDWEPAHTYIPSTPSMMTVISRSLENITAQVNSLDIEAIGDDIEMITSNLNISVQHIETITRSAAEVSDDVTRDVQVAAAGLPAIVDDLNAVVNNSDADIDRILTNLRYITEEVNELIRMIKKSPSTLLTEPPERNLSQ